MSNFPSLWRTDRQDPFRMLEREVDRLFSQVLDPTSWSYANPGTASAMFTAPCDVEETENHYLMSMDLPGMTKNDVKIELNENQLRVYGERKEEHREGKKAPYRKERYYGSFERIMTLPSGTRAEQVEAHFENGVLRIAIPKAETTQAKQIPIAEGKGGFFSKMLGKKEAPQSDKPASSGSAKDKVA